MGKIGTDEKILLVLLPYWTPLIPPHGIANLKRFLHNHDYQNVKTVDANLEQRFREIYEWYFKTLQTGIPGDNRGNFYRSGHEVLRNHMMVHFNAGNPKNQPYLEIIKGLIYNNYYVEVENHLVLLLEAYIDKFYSELDRYFIELLNKEKPAVLGLSATIGTLPASMAAFKLTRDRCPHILNVMGGSIFATGLLQSPDFEPLLEQTPYIDKIIAGEGEYLFLKLLQGELPDSQRVFTLKDIGGKSLEISSQGIPDFSDFEVGRYPYLAVQGSLSCPFNCDFCPLPAYHGQYRRKDVTQIVEEMITLYNLYGTQLFFMVDPLLNPILDHLAGALIESGKSLYIDGFIRVTDAVGDIDNTLSWRRSGLYRARIGLESGSQRVLDLMNKKITLQQSRAAVDALAYAGIKTSVYIVVGFPGETENDFQQTLDLVEELKNSIWQLDCSPFRYYYQGQGNSQRWALKRKLLYPAEYRDLLLTQTWILDGPPSREETYKRAQRLAVHCKKLGIPNPFSLNEHYKADERWKRLHENAVPSIIEFKKNIYINESKNVKKLVCAQRTWKEDGNFTF